MHGEGTFLSKSIGNLLPLMVRMSKNGFESREVPDVRLLSLDDT